MSLFSFLMEKFFQYQKSKGFRPDYIPTPTEKQPEDVPPEAPPPEDKQE